MHSTEGLTSEYMEASGGDAIVGVGTGAPSAHRST